LNFTAGDLTVNVQIPFEILLPRVLNLTIGYVRFSIRTIVVAADNRSGQRKEGKSLQVQCDVALQCARSIEDYRAYRAGSIRDRRDGFTGTDDPTRRCLVTILGVFDAKMILVRLQLGECLPRVLRTTPYLPVTRVLVMVPVVAVVVQLVWVPAVLICADIWAEIVDEMGPVTCVNPAVVASASTRFSYFHVLSARAPLGQKVKQYGHSKNFSPNGALGGGGKATASRAGRHVEGAYSDIVNVDRFSTTSSRARFRFVAVVTDAAGGANSASGTDESLDICHFSDGWEGISVPGVKIPREDIEVRA
jgi:hypothetical protein